MIVDTRTKFAYLISHMSSLVIVESPTKAKTISRFLGKDFVVKSSFGHVRDLPSKKMGVDIAHDFEPEYVVSPEKKKTVLELKTVAKKADMIYFATDEDREGEAISWHLAHLLGLDEAKARRIVFHEITEHAIREALSHPRPLDLRMVDAQQARRVLDRLVGYELSPFLWKKVRRGLSAGRVQSVALRLIVEREREIKEFKAREYWTIEAIFTEDSPPGFRRTVLPLSFEATLHAIDGKKLEKFDVKTDAEAKKIVDDLEGAEYKVAKIERKESRRNPLPPFTTSTLQQEANKHLGFSAKQTMMLAQQLYEGVELGSEGSHGLITYMRTDSVNLADKFLSEASQFIASTYGDSYKSASARRFTTKSKLAQEAHEAVRPTDVGRTPEAVKPHLDPRQWRLYDLIWKRALATQMASAVIASVAVDIETNLQSPISTRYLFRATGQTITFDGYLKIYPDAQKEKLLPDLKESEAVEAEKIEPIQHFTEPLPRYSDATLVKILEEHGIGRPSTYAPTIATLEERKYVERDDKKRFVPTDVAFVVTDLLVNHFPQIVDYEFTAKMEDELDQIAEGKLKWVPVIREFYDPFKARLLEKETEVTRESVTEEKTDIVCEKCGLPMVIKLGRYGKFLACTGYPECKNTKPLDGEKKQAPPPEPTDEKCPECGAPMVRKVGRYGPFLSCSTFPKCKHIKNIEQGTGVACPACGKGEIVLKRSRRGKPFYSCNQYPACKFALWSRPTGEKCPKCASLMVFGAKDTTRCSNKECK